MTTLNTKEVAERLDTTPKTLRRFLRSEAQAAGGTVGEDTPGKGKRYSFESKEVSKLQKRFQQWRDAQAKAAEARRQAAAETSENEE